MQKDTRNNICVFDIKVYVNLNHQIIVKIYILLFISKT